MAASVLLAAGLSKTVFSNRLYLTRLRCLQSASSIFKQRQRNVSTTDNIYCSDTVRIGCSSGFWGDTAVSSPQLINKGKIDFLVADYLSEITMSLLTSAMSKSPQLGYAPDFVHVGIGPYVATLKEKGIRVVSNAGGVNPLSCAEAFTSVIEKAGLDLKVAVVSGDDMMEMRRKFINKQIDLDSGKLMPHTINSMNAYLGAFPIAKALDMGADIVITGRCVDSALVLGPLIHKFKWKPNDFYLLASGSLAGHLIECGAQATGGIYTDWFENGLYKQWYNIGFPIVECSADGNFTITKPENTGGLVSVGTVSEQLVYEIGDPQNYILPDVVCDFSEVKLEEVAENEIAVSGVKGKPCPNDYKVSATYLDGYRATVVAMVAGARAHAKSIYTAKAILERTRNIMKQFKLGDFSRTHIKVLGDDNRQAENLDDALNSPTEAALWMAVEHKDKKPVDVFAREIAPSGTGMAPGLTGIVGGRPKVSPVLKFFSFLCPKDELKVSIVMDEQTTEYRPFVPTSSASNKAQPALPDVPDFSEGTDEYRLEELAYTRSGDKGNKVNIGVVARHPSLVPYINAALTEESVSQYFSYLFEDDDGKRIENATSLVKKFYLPGIHGFNFVLHQALGGGGVASLRPDPQGKAAGQHLVNMIVKGPKRVKTD